MKTNVKKTSIKAYNSLKISSLLGHMQLVVLNSMRKNKIYTRKEIAHKLNIETSTIAGRMNELIEKGFVFVVGKKRCPISHKTVEAIIKTN